MKNLFVLTCLLVFVSFGCKKDENNKEEESIFIVTNPLKRDTLINHEYVSQVRAIQHIELRTLEKGYLQKIYVDEGQFVKKGQLLFQIKPVIYQAETQKAQAEVNFSNIEYQNTKSLADSNIVSKNELALAGAKLEKVKAELSLAQAHLGFTEIRAPFDGIIGRFNEVRLGSLVDEGELLTTLSDNNKMWVYFNVPESEYLNYMSMSKDKKKLPLVQLKLANNDVFEQSGVVETIEADFNNETGNIAFRATFLNPKGLLRHGQTGNILMPIFLKQALLIPQKSTFEVLDKKFVFVVDDKSIVRSREIEVGAEMPHLYQVLKNLNENERILVDGLRMVKDKQKIKFKMMGLEKILSDTNKLFAE